MPIVTTSSHKRPRRSAALPVAAAAVIILAAVAFLLLRKGPAPSGPRDGVAPPRPAPIASPAPSTSPAAAAPSAAPEEPLGDPPREPAAAPSTLQPADSSTSSPPATNATLLPPRRTQRPTGFSGGPVEQLVAMMAGANDRSGMPPMPIPSEKSLLRDLEAALTNDIVVYDDDAPETVAFKERVADFKNQLAGIVRDGGSITNALKEYENWVNENKAIRDAVVQEYRRLREEASQEEADAYLAAANKELEAEGIETVNLGKERRRNRRAAAPTSEQ